MSETKGRDYSWEGGRGKCEEHSYFDGAEGDYDFTVIGLNRSTVKSGKYEDSPRAILTLDLKVSKESKGIISTGLILNEHFENTISKFFKCIGDSPADDGYYDWHWDDLIGEEGRCHIKKNDDFWNVDKWYAPTSTDSEDTPW